MGQRGEEFGVNPRLEMKSERVSTSSREDRWRGARKVKEEPHTLQLSNTICDCANVLEWMLMVRSDVDVDVDVVMVD